MSGILQIYETVLYARDLDSAVTFYNGVLGLVQLPRLGDRGVVFRVTGESVLIVFDPAQTQGDDDKVPGHGAIGAGHVAFKVSELESWRGRLSSNRFPIEREIKWPHGGQSLYVRDPDGNSVELVTGRVWGISHDAAEGDGRPIDGTPQTDVRASFVGDGFKLLLDHDGWATRRLLEICEPLSESQWRRRFPIGLGTLQETLAHIVAAMRYWSDQITGPPQPIRPFLDCSQPRTVAEVTRLFGEARSELQSAASRARVRGVETLVAVVQRGVIHRYTLGAMLAHVATHGMHHRAQCLNMLRRLDQPGISDQLPDLDLLEWELVQQSSPGSN